MSQTKSSMNQLTLKDVTLQTAPLTQSVIVTDATSLIALTHITASVKKAISSMKMKKRDQKKKLLKLKKEPNEVLFKWAR
jgi:hypothetical protein